MVGENTWINVSPHFITNLLTEIFIGISIIYLTYFSTNPHGWIQMPQMVTKCWNLLENAKYALKWVLLAILTNHLESFFCTKVRKNYQSGMPLLFQVKLSGQFEFSRLFCKFLGKNDFALTRNRTPDLPLKRRACYLKTNKPSLRFE